MNKGCETYLAHVVDTKVVSLNISRIPVVRRYPEVFPKELPELPLEREIDFTIELIPGTGPISQPPYRMAPVELKELQVQLQDLVDKGFIRPSISPWGCSGIVCEEKG